MSCKECRRTLRAIAKRWEDCPECGCSAEVRMAVAATERAQRSPEALSFGFAQPPADTILASTAIVDTMPSDGRNQGSVNVGLELAADHLKADRYGWTDILRRPYATVAFNVFYPMHLFNVAPFLRRNGIPVDRCERRSGHPRIIAGGQGISNLAGVAEPMFDEIVRGEIEGTTADRYGFLRVDEVGSGPFVRGSHATLELTRGCRYRCAFCEYGCRSGGRYREKPFELVSRQLEEIVRAGASSVNLMSVNLAGYSALSQVIDRAAMLGLQIASSDVCLMDYRRTHSLFPKLNRHSVKVGVESFDEATRKRIRKPISDSELEDLLAKLCESVSMVHLYLIFGLPDDRYERWFDWLGRLRRIRERHMEDVPTLFGVERRPTRPIRFELSITNFEPCVGTPLENAPPVNFAEKERFLVQWVEALKENGFVPPEKDVGYANCKGRFGRMETPYRVLMEVKRGGVDLYPALRDSFPRGVSRSIDQREGEAFLALCEQARGVTEAA